MKKFKKIMAVLVAAIMIVAMTVPAWAATPSTGAQSGRQDTPTYGSITIFNAEDGETYSAYKILDLYSFTDDNVAPNNHTVTKEHYAYMISDQSPWYGFISAHSDLLSAVLDDPTSANDDNYFTLDDTNPWFVDPDTYYFVTAKDNFKYSTVTDEVGRTGALGTETTGSNTYDAEQIYNTVQKFAREAMEYAVSENLDDAAASTYKKIVLAESGQTGYAASQTGAATASTDVTDKVVIEFTDLDLGYYLVDSSIGTMVALDTTNSSVQMYDKNLSPTIEKKVRARQYSQKARNTTTLSYGTDKATWFVDNDDYEIGSVVTFLTTINVKKGAKGYVLHDVMEKGFTFDPASVKVYATDGTKAAGYLTLASADDYTLKYEAASAPASQVTDGSDFEIAFKDDFLAELPDNSIIEVEYQAKLNTDAYVFSNITSEESDNTTLATNTLTTILSKTTDLEAGPVNPGASGASGVPVPQIRKEANGDNKNTNSAILTYGNKSATEWAVATVETYLFDLIKTKEEAVSNGTNTYDLLGQAKFKLYQAVLVDDDADTDTFYPYWDKVTNGDTAKSANEVTFTLDNTGTGVKVYTVDESGSDQITTDDIKKVSLHGLKAGTYYLVEDVAPTGFHKLPGYYKITIARNDTAANNGKITYEYVNDNNSTGENGYNPGTSVAFEVPADKLILGNNNGGVLTPSKYTEGTGLHIINKTSTELPSTGGMGTTVLYIVGGMLVILAGAYLFFSRKKTA